MLNNFMIYTIISSVLVLLEVLLILWLYKKFIRFLIRKETWFGTPPSLWVTTLAIAAIIFPGTIYSVFLRPLVFVVQELSAHSMSIKNLLVNGTGNVTNEAGYNVIDRLFSSLLNFLSMYNIISIILCFALCVIIILSLRKNFNDGQGNYSTSHLDYTYKRIAILVFFIMGSLYVIFTSLVALTYMQKNTVSIDWTSNKLDSVLKNVSTTELENVKLNHDSVTIGQKLIAIKRIVSLSDTDKTILKNDTAKSLPVFKKYANKGYKQLEGFENRKQEFVRLFTAKKEKLVKEQAKNLTDIKSKYTYEKNNLSNYLAQSYFLQLQSWYRNEIDVSIGTLNYLQERYTFFEISFLDFANGLYDDVEKNYKDLQEGKYTDDDGRYLSFRSENIDIELLRMLTALNEDTYFLRNLPSPPKSGTEWGPIGRSAAWLLLPSSIDLILIIGMFGFGLFGAAISTFIRERQNSTEPVSANVSESLAKVLIKGVSAAIVVFLATKGGIALINNGTNDPNAFVLFFTCLVGAVFSDEIWDWAKTKLKFGSATAQAQNQETIKPGKPQ